MNRREQYKQLQAEAISSGENDPEFITLPYVADYYKLNLEERYWLAYLFSACYNDATAWAMFKYITEKSEENLNKFWEDNKLKLDFTTDRAKVKNFDKFVPMTLSYLELMKPSQIEIFEKLKDNNKHITYNNVYHYLNKIYYVGRFTLFLYTESIYQLTKFSMMASCIPLEDSDSSRNGLCYVLELDDWIIHKGEHKVLTKEQYKFLYEEAEKLLKESQQEFPNLEITYWNMETFLCAYKKYYWKTRYMGYYLDRQLEGIKKMEQNYPELQSDWNLFYEARKNKCNLKYLGELNGWNGIRKQLMGYPIYGKLNIN